MTSKLAQALAELFGGVIPPQAMEARSLRGMDLTGLDLGPGDDPFAPIERTDLSGWDLREANLDGMDLRSARFIGSDLRGASLKHCRFGGRFGGLEDETTFEGSDLRGACFDGSMGGGRFTKTDCRKASFRSVRMGRSPEEGRPLQSNFSNADLREAVLDGGDFQVCVFANTDMRNGSFLKCDFRAAAFREVDAMGGDFRGSCLKGVWLQDRRTPFWRSEGIGYAWAGAKLDGADLSGLGPDDWRLLRYAEGVERVLLSKLPWLTNIPVIGSRLWFLWRESVRTKAWSGAGQNSGT